MIHISLCFYEIVCFTTCPSLSVLLFLPLGTANMCDYKRYVSYYITAIRMYIMTHTHAILRRDTKDAEIDVKDFTERRGCRHWQHCVWTQTFRAENFSNTVCSALSLLFDIFSDLCVDLSTQATFHRIVCYDSLSSYVMGEVARTRIWWWWWKEIRVVILHEANDAAVQDSYSSIAVLYIAALVTPMQRASRPGRQLQELEVG